MSTIMCSICFDETSKNEATRCIHSDVWLCKNCVEWRGWFLPICKCPHCGREVLHAIGSPVKGLLKTSTIWYVRFVAVFLLGIAKIFSFILDQIPSRR